MFCNNTVLPLLLVGMVSCKPAGQDANLKTLDNLAAGSRVHTNTCLGSAEDAKKIDVSDIFVAIDPGLDKDAIKKEIGITLTALPQPYLDAFVLGKGAIVVTKDAASLCSLNGASGIASYETTVTACNFGVEYSEEVRKRMGNQLQSDGNFIIIDATPSEISHGLVRAFGYLFVADIAKTFNEDGMDPEKFARLQGELASAFISDIKLSNGVFNLKNLEVFLGTGADSIIESNFKKYRSEGNESFNPIEGLKITPQALDRFGEFVAVDAFDSWYCNNDQDVDAFNPDVVAKIQSTRDLSGFNALRNTRKIMKTFFPNTYDAFVPMNRYLADLAINLAKIKPKKGGSSLTDDANEDGFSLQGHRTTQAQRDARIVKNYNAYIEQKNSAPSTWEKIRHPFENAQERRERLSLENMAVRSAYLNLSRKDGEKIKVQSAGSPTLAAAGGAVVGLGTGAKNVVVGTAGTVAAVGVAGYSVGKTAVTQGVGAAGKQVADAYNQGVQEAGERLGEKYYNIQNSKGNAFDKALKYTVATGGEAGIVGPYFRSVENTAKVFGEKDIYSGKQLSYEDMTQISKDQGNVAGQAVVAAAVGKGLESGTHALINAPAKVLSRTATALEKGGQATMVHGQPTVTLSTLAQRSTAPMVQNLATAAKSAAHAPLTQVAAPAAESAFKYGVIQPLEVKAHHEVPTWLGGGGHGGSHGNDHGGGHAPTSSGGHAPTSSSGHAPTSSSGHAPAASSGGHGSSPFNTSPAPASSTPVH